MIDRRSTTQVDVEKLARLARQRIKSERLAVAASDILADWRIGMPPDERRGEVKALCANIEAGVQAAEEYVSEAESEVSKVAAAKQLEGLRAVRRVLVGELEGVG